MVPELSLLEPAGLNCARARECAAKQGVRTGAGESDALPARKPGWAAIFRELENASRRQGFGAELAAHAPAQSQPRSEKVRVR